MCVGRVRANSRHLRCSGVITVAPNSASDEQAASSRAGSTQRKLTPTNRDLSSQAFGPVHAGRFQRYSVSKGRYGVTGDVLLLSVCEQDPERVVGIQDGAHVGHADGSVFAKFGSDLLEPWGLVEDMGSRLADGETHASAHRNQVENRTQTIRTIIVAQFSAQPHALVVTTDPGAMSVNRATRAAANVLAAGSAELRDLVDTQYRATQRALTARTARILRDFAQRALFIVYACVIGICRGCSRTRASQSPM